ncbi:MAG: TetR family transcriptional regulator [Actinomycetota bacterium]|nr:TetR family transcriptional regulator [Actinomycetota bacterium]
MAARSGSMTRSQHMTSVEEIEKAALEVIAARGFDETTVEELAAAAGISRRTFFRYFASKNDIPFGNFGALLEALEEWLAAAPTDRPMFEVIAEAVMHFNRVHTDGAVAHRARMRLIMQTPSLRANAVLHQDDWVSALARYAGRRLGASPESFGPRLVAHISLGAANAAYEQWLDDDRADLAELVGRAFAAVDITAITAIGRP